MFYANLLTQTKSNSDSTPINDIPPCWNMTKIFEFYMLDWSQCVMASKRGRRRKQSDFDWIVLILIFSPFHLFFFTCAFYRDILNSHTCTRVQFEGRMHKVMWAELKSLCSTYLFCAPAWLFTTSNSYICIYCQGLLSRFIQIKSGVIWVERMNAWTWIKLRKGKIE